MIRKREICDDVDRKSDVGIVKFPFETVQDWKVVDYKNGAVVWVGNGGDYVKFDKNN